MQLKGSIPLNPLSHRLLIGFLFIMLMSPILINLSMANDTPLLTALLSHIGYLWMGALFLFFSLHLMFDIFHGLCALASRFISPFILKIIPGNRLSLSITLLMVMMIVFYGVFEANKIRVKRVVMKTKKLPSEITSLRIVQISDIHFSPTVSVRMAKKIVKTIEGISPDILVSTGDFIDRGLYGKEKVAALFHKLNVPYGKYAVMGNHEFYTGIEESVGFTEKAGFRMLRNEGVTAGDVVNVAGVDDPTGKRPGNPPPSEDTIIRGFSNGKLTILLKHQPTVIREGNPGFDLQLSGHTHKGQIFPFGLISSRFFPYHSGLFKVGEVAHLYVNRGTGTWGPPMRFLAPPEITVISFYPLL